MERANWTFEEQWRQALDAAEVTPPPQIWVAIDGQLANQQLATYKKENTFYKWVAAACLLLFAFGTAMVWQYRGQDVQVAQDISIESWPIDTAPREPSNSKEERMVSEYQKQKDLVESATLVENTRQIPTPISVATVIPLEDQEVLIPLEIKNRRLTAFEAIRSKTTELTSVLEPWLAEHLYGVPDVWSDHTADNMVAELWAGVSFSAGAFDPGLGSSDQQSSILFDPETSLVDVVRADAPLSSPSYASGRSLATGLDVGKQLGQRLMLSSGLHYSAFTTGSASSQLVSDGSQNTFALTSETSDPQLKTALDNGELRYAGQQVQLTNEYQYLTIPVKAGYVLLNKRFNVILNTGISGNFLIDSRLVASGATSELNNDFSTTQNYERVYLNFLTSIAVGYRFREHYQLLLEPSYNQALTDFTNSNRDASSKPRNFGLSVGFRYNF